MSTFALNKLGKLEGITYQRHPSTPDVIYLRAFDMNSDNQVVWPIAKRVISRDHLQVITEISDELMMDMYMQYPDGSYACGLAVVQLMIEVDKRLWAMGVIRLNPTDYAAIVAEASR